MVADAPLQATAIEAPPAMYVSLHNHSQFSLLDGMASPWQLVGVAKQLGMPAIALTDHGNCAGLFEFVQAARKCCLCSQCRAILDKDIDPKTGKCPKCGGAPVNPPIKPIMGMEAYFVNDMAVREKAEKRWHLTLWAKNKIGYRNLIALSSLGYTRGFYSRPRIDWETLRVHRDGMMAGSACASGAICEPFISGRPELAKANAEKFREILGDDFYIEVMPHQFNDPTTTDRIRGGMKETHALAQQMGIKPIFTCDAHYCMAEDWDVHDVLLSISTRDTIKNPKRFTFDSKDFYLKPPMVAAQRVSRNLDLLTNTMEVAAKVEDGVLEPSKDTLPLFPLPPDQPDELSYLRQLVLQGMKARGLDIKPNYRERVLHELSVIQKTGYAKYFLILYDLIAFARQSKIRVGPGRGSGVASLCLYCLGVTALDPIRYKLMFSRFLNPDRISPPDVDIDFDRTKQQQIVDYAMNKYGNECVVRIATYHSLRARDAIKRAAKALDIGGDFDPKIEQRGQWESGPKTLDIVGRIASFVPEELHVTVASALRDSEALRACQKKYPELFRVAHQIEGTLSTASVHAAGVIICKEPVVNYVPLRTAEGVVTSQFTMTEIEALGLLKFDILALKTLTMIEHCLRLIKGRGLKGGGCPTTDGEIDLNLLDPDGPDSPPVFQLLNAGRTDGVFQFEGRMATDMLAQIHVDSFEDMVAVNALNRPGTLAADVTVGNEVVHGVHNLYCDYKHKRRQVQYVHPKMKEALKDTYGMMIFQEDLVRVAMEVASYTASQADKLRKACGKKIESIMVSERQHFVEGCAKNNVDATSANKIFDLIALFAGYGFNRSHSAAYSLLGYQTAWLKCYYPKEFYAALLTIQNDEVKRDRYERSAGVDILPPDVSRSTGLEYMIEETGIRRPLTAVKGVGEKAAVEIVSRQPFKNLVEFVRKMTGVRAVHSRVFEALARAGAMDRWGIRRDELLREYERVRVLEQRSTKRRKAYGTSDGDLLDAV